MMSDRPCSPSIETLNRFSISASIINSKSFHKIHAEILTTLCKTIPLLAINKPAYVINILNRVYSRFDIFKILLGNGSFAYAHGRIWPGFLSMHPYPNPAINFQWLLHNYIYSLCSKIYHVLVKCTTIKNIVKT